jgi:hypothetical protein
VPQTLSSADILAKKDKSTTLQDASNTGMQQVGIFTSQMDQSRSNLGRWPIDDPGIEPEDLAGLDWLVGAGAAGTDRFPLPGLPDNLSFFEAGNSILSPLSNVTGAVSATAQSSFDAFAGAVGFSIFQSTISSAVNGIVSVETLNPWAGAVAGAATFSALGLLPDAVSALNQWGAQWLQQATQQLWDSSQMGVGGEVPDSGAVIESGLGGD